MAGGADWSSIPELLVDLILSKLSCSLKDLVVFAATCRNWRSAVKQSNTRINTNWLITPELVFHDTASSTRFVLHLPEMRGFVCFGSGFGWLIAFRALEPEIKLVNPLSRASIPLPPVPSGFRSTPVNASLTANPSDPACLVVVEYSPGKLAFAKPRAQSWRRVPSDFHAHSFVCLKQKLYCIRWRGHADPYCIKCYDLSFDPPRAVGFGPPPELWLRRSRRSWANNMFPHLVEIQGHLCLLVRFLYCSTYYFIQIFKLDPAADRWAPVESLGNSCLVVQDNVNFSLVDADDGNKLIPGCIYYPRSPDFGSVNPSAPRISDDYVNHLVYYPTASVVDCSVIWANDESFQALSQRTMEFPCGKPPPCVCLYEDTYSKAYPSILLRMNLRLGSFYLR